MDGDTLHLDVDLGFFTRMKIIVRLYGLNTPKYAVQSAQPACAPKPTSPKSCRPERSWS